MIPRAESDRIASNTRFGGSRTAGPLVLFAALTMCFGGVSNAFASSGLTEDQAVIVGSDGVIYSLDLATAIATSTGVSISGDVPQAGYSALEANPTSDTLYLTSGIDAALTSVDYVSGVSTYIEDDYGTNTGAALTGIVRLSDGDVYLSYSPPAGGQHSVSLVDLDTGVLSRTQPVMLGSTNTILQALTHVDDTVYAFGFTSSDELFSLDLDTGALTSVRAATGEVISGRVVGADSTADGQIYFVTYDAVQGSDLYSTDPSGSTARIGPITGLANGAKAEHLAIATLLTSERPAPEPTPDPAPEPRESSRDDDADDVVVSTVLPPLPTTPPVQQPEPAPEQQQEPVDTVSVAPEPSPPASPPPAPENTSEGVGEAEQAGEFLPLHIVVGIALGTLGFMLGFFLLLRRLERRRH